MSRQTMEAWACSTVRRPLNQTMNDAVHEEFVELHVVSKNVQGIRTDRRLEDLLSEVALCQFDALCLSGCWRANAEECIETVNGDLVYLSGGSMYRGVGVIISAQFRKKIEHVSFHACGPRLCLLKFCLGELKCECFLYISRQHGTPYTKLCSYYWTTVGQAALFPLPVVTSMHRLAHCWMVKTMICLDPGVLVKELGAEDGLYNGFYRMDCVWRAVSKLVTRRRVGPAEGSLTGCLCKLILSWQMLKPRWKQTGTIS